MMGDLAKLLEGFDFSFGGRAEARRGVEDGEGVEEEEEEEGYEVDSEDALSEASSSSSDESCSSSDAGSGDERDALIKVCGRRHLTEEIRRALGERGRHPRRPHPARALLPPRVVVCCR